VGADPSDESAWTELPVSDAGFTVPAFMADTSGVRQVWLDETHGYLPDGARELKERLIKAQHSYSWPRRYVMGIDPATHFTFDERKPMGLSKEYAYTDNDGDTLTIDENGVDDEATGWISDMSEDGFNITAANSVPLALNMLGYDRPKAGAAVHAKVGNSSYGYSADYLLGSSSRESLVAQAIANLLAVDSYDQRQDERKARDEERKARIAARDAARARLDEVIEYTHLHGITTLNADSLQIAVSEYKKAVAEVGAPSAP
jgi:hypothetical protein